MQEMLARSIWLLCFAFISLSNWSVQTDLRKTFSITFDKTSKEYTLKDFVDYNYANSDSFDRKVFNRLEEYDQLFWFEKKFLYMEASLEKFWWKSIFAGELDPSSGGASGGKDPKKLRQSHEGEFWISATNNPKLIIHENEVFVSDNNSLFSGSCKDIVSDFGYSLVNVSSHNTVCSWGMENASASQRIVVLPMGKWGDIMYYHFWTETFSHWFTLPESIRNDKTIKVAIDERRSFSKLAYESIGLEPDRVLELSRVANCYYPFKEIIIPTLPHCMKPLLPQMKLVRHYFGIVPFSFQEYSLPPRKPVFNYDDVKKPSNPNIMIILDRKAKRSVNNTDEMVEALKRRYEPKWVIVKYDTMPVSETIEIFRHAKLIIGHHGAGFLNMLFSTRAGIIEIHDTNKSSEWVGGIVNCYINMARQLEFPYIGLHGVRSTYDIPKVIAHVDMISKELKLQL